MRQGRKALCPAATTLVVLLVSVLARGSAAQVLTDGSPVPHEAGQDLSAYRRDARGRPFRVAFDPASQLRIGLGYGLVHDGRSWGDGLDLSWGMRFRNRTRSRTDEPGSSWQLDHQVLDGWVRLDEGAPGLPIMDVVAYSGSYLYHLADPFLLFPGDPPTRIPFPLDIGAETELGSLQIPMVTDKADGTLEDAVRIGVARSSFLLDPWRTGRPGNSLEIGLGLRYDIELAREIESDRLLVVHQVAPMTAASLRWRTQDTAGLTVLDLRGDAVYSWSSRNDWDWWWSARAEFERVLLAVDDQPLSAFVEAEVVDRPLPAEQERTLQVRGLCGLRIGFQWAVGR